VQGSWGTTLACLLSKKRFDVIIWAREKEIVDAINNKKRIPCIYRILNCLMIDCYG